MIHYPNKISAVICFFFILVFAISYTYNPHYPVLIIAGEDSVGTWMSGVLLIISATTSLVLGVRKNWLTWFLIAVFFFVLALDERFMFHERIKMHLILSFHATSRWIYELPVLTGACIGALISLTLWYKFNNINRILLASALILGSASVIFDVFNVGVFFEDCFKLLAELLITCSLVRKIEEELK